MDVVNVRPILVSSMSSETEGLRSCCVPGLPIKLIFPCRNESAAWHAVFLWCYAGSQLPSRRTVDRGCRTEKARNCSCRGQLAESLCRVSTDYPSRRFVSTRALLAALVVQACKLSTPAILRVRPPVLLSDHVMTRAAYATTSHLLLLYNRWCMLDTATVVRRGVHSARAPSC